MRIVPHLIFDGQCRTAFLAYQEILGGNLVTMLAYGESPMAAQVDPRWHARIVHATLQVGEFELTGVDALPDGYQRPQGFYVTVTAENPQRGAEIFQALALGGETRLPFQETFWSAGFGVLIDRFGVPWEVSSESPGAGA